MIIICFFIVFSAYFVAETKGYACIEGRCTCMSDGWILCVDVIDEELLDFSNMMVTQFHGIVVKHEMTKKKAVMDGHPIGQYIYETFTCVLLVLSLMISAKIRQNIAPVVNRLLQTYLSNQTFIKNLFKVCKTFYLLFLQQPSSRDRIIKNIDVTYE